jgi:hypothetical protein
MKYTNKMATVEEYSRVSRLSFVLKLIGDRFLNLKEFVTVTRKFVYREVVPDSPRPTNGKEKKRKLDDEDESFISECESTIFLCPELKLSHSVMFKEFNEYVLKSGQPIATILISSREKCRICTTKLTVEDKSHPVVIYDYTKGTFLGCRVVKFCRRCKINEHHGFWTMNGARQFDIDESLRNEYFLSTEDTAFESNMLKMYANLLIVGALPFSTFCSSYNRKNGYTKGGNSDDGSTKNATAFKRRKRYENQNKIIQVSVSCLAFVNKSL